MYQEFIGYHCYVSEHVFQSTLWTYLYKILFVNQIIQNISTAWDFWDYILLIEFTEGKPKVYMSIVSFSEKYRVFNLKVDRILVSVIYLLRFTTCYIIQLNCIYSKCWKRCPFISMHLSLVLTLISADYDSSPKVNLFHGIFLFIFAIALFAGACLLNFSKKLCLQWA